MKAVSTLAALPFALVALAAAAAQLQPHADQGELGAVVLDQDGATVPNLTREDFELLEDGRPVPMSSFAAIDADHPATGNDGRFLVLLVEPHSTAARKLANDLINRMGASDVVAVLGMTGSRATTTGDRQAALKQLGDLTPPAARRPPPATAIGNVPQENCSECGAGTVTSGWLGHAGPTGQLGDSGILGMRRGQATLPGAAGTSSYAINALAKMAALADRLAQVPHRHKSIVYIGPGSPLNLMQGNVTHGDPGRWFDVVRHVSRANVSVSVISIDGLTGKSYAGARLLADETGGDAIVDTNLFDQGIERLCQRTGQYYLLGYAPVDDGDKRHAIEVRVDRPGFEVHALKARD